MNPTMTLATMPDRSVTAIEPANGHLYTTPNPFDHPVCLSHPLRIVPSGWVQHVPFGMFVVDLARPTLLVELGTHRGVSFCAFCQAVQELGLDTRCYAVDSWRGDPQAGFYGPEVLTELRNHHDQLYGGFSRLIQSTFDDALAHFPAGSIDILHIDGFHTQDAAAHDFSSWLPKMSRQGVILFHDTNCREHDFGVWRLWADLQRQFPSFELLHGHGLGLLSVGPDPSPGIRALTRAEQGDIHRLRRTFFALGSHLEERVQRDALQAMNLQHLATIRAIQGTADRQHERIQQLEESAAVVRAPHIPPPALTHDGVAAELLQELRGNRSDQDDFRSVIAVSTEHLEKLRTAVQEIRTQHELLHGTLSPLVAGQLEARDLHIERQALDLTRLRAALDLHAEAEHHLQRRTLAQEEQFALLANAARAANARLRSLGRQEEPSAADRSVDYAQLIVRFGRLVRSVIANAGAVVAVATKGDDRLLAVPDCVGRHFPQSPDGSYAGFYPPDSRDAILQVELLRAGGADYLAFPATSAWWLTHYAGLRDHLNSQYERILADEFATVYRLRSPTRDTTTGHVPPAVEAVATDAVAALAELHEEVEAALTRSRAAELLAMRDGRDALARARLAAFLHSGGRLWFRKVRRPVLTVIIPTYNQAHYTYGLLESMRACADEVPFEVVIVDNASADDSRPLFARLDNVRVLLNDTNAGFGGACDAGAKTAIGKYLCFLNSDVLLTPGCLAALVEAVTSDPGCGAVGAKLVHADGRLQEAGSIIWADGSAQGYGRGDEPFRSEYGHRREVDFCSAACLLVRRDAFVKVGGFDDRYAPAYYEDADLCFSLRAAGYHVTYEPRAVALHLEFGSSTPARAVALQLQNRMRFVAKWRRELAVRPQPAAENVMAARDLRLGRRILVLDDRVPTPGAGSGFPRCYALLNTLADLGWVVTYLPLTDRHPYQPTTSDLQRRGIEVLHGMADPKAVVNVRTGIYDVVIVSRPHNAHMMAAARAANPVAAMIYDAEAVYALRDIAQAKALGHPLSPSAASARLQHEASLLAGADLVVAVSEVERRAIVGLSPAAPVVVWGHPSPREPGASTFAKRRDFLFVGNLATAPNADAVEILVREVFPRIARTLAARLVVAGAGRHPAEPDSHPPLAAVVFAGFVEDLRSLYDRSRVFLAPHRFAAGVPLKVIEAMANGVPCVVSPILAKQLGVRDGHEVLVGRNGVDLSRKAARLYRDERLWMRIRQAALDYVRVHHDPVVLKEQLRQYLDRAMNGRPGEAS